MALQALIPQILFSCFLIPVGASHRLADFLPQMVEAFSISNLIYAPSTDLLCWEDKKAVVCQERAIWTAGDTYRSVTNALLEWLQLLGRMYLLVWGRIVL